MSSEPAADPGTPTGLGTHDGHRAADDDLRLARLHLRLGLLTLARAELEDLAARDRVDLDGTAALAEARWRTGEPDAAADAARAHLDAGGTDEVAICIAAEAAASDGNPDAARELMDRLGLPDPVLVDALFAGMPQRASWAVASDPGAAPEHGRGRSDARAVPATGPRGTSETPGSIQRERRALVGWDPAAELRRAREELGSRPERAYVRLALVLRLDPTLAAAVLDVVALRREPAAALVRGDAQRLLGRHLEAEAAFEAAAETLEAM